MEDIKKRIKAFDILNKIHNNLNLDYGTYLLAIACFGTKKINRLYGFSIKINEKINQNKKSNKKSLNKVIYFFKKNKILDNIRICEIGGNDALKLRKYSAKTKTTSKIISLQNYKEIFENKKFDVSCSAYLFSDCNNVITDKNNQFYGIAELLAVFYKITKKKKYIIHFIYTALKNKKINELMKKMNLKKVYTKNGLLVLKK